MTIAERLLEQGIRPRRFGDGEQKMTCPRCSHDRRNKTDPCLSLKIDAETAIWRCHHCGWGGGTGPEREQERPRRRPAKPVKPKLEGLGVTAELLEWFASRGIPEGVVRRNGIEMARAWIPAREAEVEAIAFPYRRDGELVNVKYRTRAKEFAQTKGAAKILYGLDDLGQDTAAIIVEGELDKLALEVAGYRNVLSVPDGAPEKVGDGDRGPTDVKFSYLANCADQLERLTRIILAVDADGPGLALEEELARRLGKERCWRVRWPDGNDAPSKDANDVLMTCGEDVLRECVEAAEPYPIVGLYRAADYLSETVAMFHDGLDRGVSTGWPALDSFYRVRPGEMSVVTGFPNHGKSEWIDAVMVNIAQREGWRFAVCSFENTPPDHIAKLAEKHVGAPFWQGRTLRMSEADLRSAIDWVSDRFVFIRAEDEAPTIDWILDRAKAAVLRHGVRGLVIDPYNELEHRRASNQTETEYVSQALAKTKRFAANFAVHVWFVAHPAKPPREAGAGAAPALYDISGSANWANKADTGIVVHRPDPADTITAIHIRKVRSKAFGRLGVLPLAYDRATGRYSQINPSARRVAED
jgi:twinkle protein